MENEHCRYDIMLIQCPFAYFVNAVVFFYELLCCFVIFIMYYLAMYLGSLCNMFDLKHYEEDDATGT